ncbi:MAG: metal ABC transporter permease [Cyclobacteriaceae bacterium]
MENLVSFFSFEDPNVRYVVIGSILLTATSAIVGTFTFLKKKALVGDAVAHSVLPGVCLSFILWGEKNPLILIPGAFLTGWLSLVLIDYIRANSKIKEDTAIGLILSVFFGIGIFMLTIIQKSGDAAQSGLDSFLFGQAASLIGQDLIVFSITALLLLITVFFLFKELTIIAFDPDFAATVGLPVRAIELVLTTLTVLAVVIGIQAVGVVLMAAMLITPAAAARFWTENVKKMVLLAALFGAISGLAGAFISYTAPSMPTGPWIVVVVSLIAFFSFFFAPGKGIIHRLLITRRIRRSMTDENILKTIYNLGESGNEFSTGRTFRELLDQRSFEQDELKDGLKRLTRDGFLELRDNAYFFTQDGKAAGLPIRRSPSIKNPLLIWKHYRSLSQALLLLSRADYSAIT